MEGSGYSMLVGGYKQSEGQGTEFYTGNETETVSFSNTDTIQKKVCVAKWVAKNTRTSKQTYFINQ